MGLWFLVVAVILGILAALHYRYEEFHIVKLGTMAVALFWGIYGVTAGLFFLMDKFSFTATLLAMLGVVLIVDIGLFVKHGKKPLKPVFSWERDGVALALALVALLLTGSKFELFHTAQDQGLYQTEALELYMGNFEVEHDFEEYQILEKQEDKDAYQHMLDNTWYGYYPLKIGNYTSQLETKSDVSGMYHGVQTFPAMLALAARLFGMKNMVQVQTVFYLCGIMLLFYAMCELKIRRGNQIFLTLVFMLSPLVLWISKASYTEMFLTMIICLYLLLLFEEHDRKWMIALPLTAFSFVHVSYLMLWPCFWLVNAMLYIYEKNRQYIYANMVSAIGMLAGYFMMGHIAPEYFYMNCGKLYIGGIITADNLLIWILGLVVASCVVSFVMLRIALRPVQDLAVRLQKVKWLVPLILLCAIVYWIIYGIRIGYFEVPESVWRPEMRQYYGQGLVAFTHLGIYACAMATGFVILPVTIGWLVLRAGKIQEKSKQFILTFLFLYIVVFQCVFLRREIYYYYYYSRYLTYWVPVVCLLAAVCFEGWKKIVLLPLAVVSLSCMLYFDVAIIENKDDTIWEWESLEDLAATIPEESALIISGTELQRMLGPQVRTITETAVFPVFEDKDAQIQLLFEEYNSVYILAENEADINSWGKVQTEIVYRDPYLRSQTGSYVVGIYPTDIESEEKELILYQLKRERYEPGSDIYFASTNRTAEKYVLQGLGHNEGEYSWTDGKYLHMQLWIPEVSDSVELHAEFQVAYVFNGSQRVQIMVNGALVCETVYTGDGSLEFDFKPGTDGMVDMELIFPDAVSPKDLGQSEDARELALALVKATIQ